MSSVRKKNPFIFLVKAAIRFGLMLPILFASTAANAQDKAEELYISGNLSLDSLTSLVHARTGVRFSFNSAKVKGSKVISFPQAKYSIPNLLQHLHRTTALYYFSYKKYYIFQDNPPKPRKKPVASAKPLPLPQKDKVPVVKRQVSSGRQSLQSAEGRSSSTVPLVKFAHVDTVTIVTVNLDTVATPAMAQNKAAKQILRVPTLKDSLDSTTKPPLVVVPQISKRTNASKSLFHFQGGFFSTEVLYANAGIEVGIRPIHAQFSFATNFEVGGPRIGLGSIIKNRSGKQWQINASVCFLQRTYEVDSASIFIPFKIKGQLYNAGIYWCKKMKSHTLFKAGLLFNLLHSTYYNQAGQERVLGVFPYFNGNADKRVHLLHPPYLISNSYDDFTTSNNKIWIGLSIGFYYTLPPNSK